jgi:hypothetical protein
LSSKKCLVFIDNSSDILQVYDTVPREEIITHLPSIRNKT